MARNSGDKKHPKPPVRIAVPGDNLETMPRKKCPQALRRMFIAVFGVNGLARLKWNCQSKGSNLDGLLAGTDQVHLNSAKRFVEPGLVAKGGRIKIGLEGLIDPCQNV